MADKYVISAADTVNNECLPYLYIKPSKLLVELNLDHYVSCAVQLFAKTSEI